MDIWINAIAEIVTVLVTTAIGVAGAWLLAKMAKYQEVATVRKATEEVIILAQQTVGELMQTIVEGIKASREDGKLTQTEIEALGQTLLVKVTEKMSEPTRRVLEAAAVDITALIRGAGEEYIATLKTNPIPVILPEIKQE